MRLIDGGRKAVVALAWVGLVAAPSWAATRNVACSGVITSTLQSAIDASVDSDIVSIGAGSCSAGSVSWANKNITVQGQGIGVTTVSGLSFQVTDTTKAAFRITGMSVGAPNLWRINAVNRTTGIKGWRIDHVEWTYPACQQNIAIQIDGINWGLIDNNRFTNAGNAIFIRSFAENTDEVNPWPPDGSPGMGGYSWLLPLNLGSDEAVYVEDNVFTMGTGCFFGVGDMYYGGRMVFRHNKVTNAYWQNHAARSYERGGNLKAEIYNNDFNATDSNWYRAIHIRSGTGVVFNNSLRGFFNTMQVDNQRSNGQNTSTPFGACNGSSPWDGNQAGQSGYPCLDQIGRGTGQYPNQPAVPLYVWNNGSSQGCSTSGSCTGLINMVGDGDAHVQAGRDFINNGTTAKPGYTPYTYPHPLTQSTSAGPAQWFVRPNGTVYGTGNGTSWTNAWSGFSAINWASVACGDTIWVAGGTYTQALSPAKKCASSAPLALRRARSDAAEATGAAGWQSGFNAQVVHTNSINFNGDYDAVIISGRTSAGGGAHGWRVDLSNTTGGCAVCFNAASSDNNRLEYLDLQGPGPINYTSSGRGIDASPPSGSITGNAFSHIKIWDFETCALNVASTNTLWEYLDISDCHANNWADYHPNGLIIWSANTGIVRYSKFHSGPRGVGVGEGLFFEQSGGCSDWQIYGNTFYDLKGTGKKALEVTASCPNMKIFNNTFVDCDAAMYLTVSCATGSETRNNLFYNAGLASCGTTSNNLSASSSNVFAGYAAKDYHIVAATGAGYPRNAGTALAADGFINKDMDGTTRGADGAWDVGAYEYGAGGTTPSPCDVNASGGPDVLDVQLAVNQALGTASCLPAGQAGSADINRDNRCDVVDVQRVVNAALGGACVSP